MVMTVTVDAHADPDASNMNADCGGADSACTQQGQGKKLKQ
jgi:hypothetical protein